jgi:hypothetical protein
MCVWLLQLRRPPHFQLLFHGAMSQVSRHQTSEFEWMLLTRESLQYRQADRPIQTSHSDSRHHRVCNTGYLHVRTVFVEFISTSSFVGLTDWLSDGFIDHPVCINSVYYVPWFVIPSCALLYQFLQWVFLRVFSQADESKVLPSRVDSWRVQVSLLYYCTVYRIYYR